MAQTSGTLPALYDNTRPRPTRPASPRKEGPTMAGKKCEYTTKGGKGGRGK